MCIRDSSNGNVSSKISHWFHSEWENKSEIAGIPDFNRKNFAHLMWSENLRTQGSFIRVQLSLNVGLLPKKTAVFLFCDTVLQVTFIQNTNLLQNFLQQNQIEISQWRVINRNNLPHFVWGCSEFRVKKREGQIKNWKTNFKDGVIHSRFKCVQDSSKYREPEVFQNRRLALENSWAYLAAQNTKNSKLKSTCEKYSKLQKHIRSSINFKVKKQSTFTEMRINIWQKSI